MHVNILSICLLICVFVNTSYEQNTTEETDTDARRMRYPHYNYWWYNWANRPRTTRPTTTRKTTRRTTTITTTTPTTVKTTRRPVNEVTQQPEFKGLDGINSGMQNETLRFTNSNQVTNLFTVKTYKEEHVNKDVKKYAILYRKKKTTQCQSLQNSSTFLSICDCNLYENNYLRCEVIVIF